MSQSYANTFLARQCGSCSEIMPIFEKICYCDGSVTLVRLLLDKKEVSNNYSYRRTLYFLKKINLRNDK